MTRRLDHDREEQHASEQECRDMVKALREWLGLEPLYGADPRAQRAPITFPAPWVSRGSEHE